MTTLAPTIFICFVCLMMPSSARVDKTMEKGAWGQAVVQATIKKVQDSCIFSNDRQFLRHVAWTVSEFGMHFPAHFDKRKGMWRLDELAFNRTMNSHFYHPTPAKWNAILQLIESRLHIDYRRAQWKMGHLQIPLVGCIAARFYMKSFLNAPLKWSVADQASYWQHTYLQSVDSQERQRFINAVGRIPPSCTAAGADILFILDSSGSIGLPNWRKIISFVQTLVASLPIGERHFKFAVDRFSNSAESMIKFNSYSDDLQTLLGMIGALRWTKGHTRTFLALDLAVDSSFSIASGARDIESGYPRIVVLITDGLSDEPPRTQVAAARARDAGLVLFTLGVGDTYTKPPTAAANARRELVGMVSQPKCMHAYPLDYDDLAQGFPEELISQTCHSSAVIDVHQHRIANQLNANQSLYFKFAANLSSGIEMDLSMDSGSAILYLSQIVRNPSEVEYDYKLTADVSKSAHISLNRSQLLGGMANHSNSKSEFGANFESYGSGILLMDEVRMAREGNETVPIFASIYGGQQAQNNFTITTRNGNPFSPAGHSGRAKQCFAIIAFALVLLATLFTSNYEF